MQPKKVELDAAPRPCPNCGHPAARLKRLDHYLSLFFIPLFPIKKGEEFLDCPRCGPVGGNPLHDWQKAGSRIPSTCPACRRPLEPGFSYCPYCGQKL